eukprot:TRINITY_DN27572_c0_g2_i2.p1 TRINITY_DN27572_c0_g2~~TRINITY_DN27572_c0_g2_i2.p1  ORF type:complete len:378 (+),score=21.09 TRINITY_DN27572_c0_g2_i2:62-1135(+)
MGSESLAETLLSGTDGKHANSAQEEITNVMRWMWTMTLYAAITSVGVALAMLGPTLLGLTDSLQISATAGSAFFSVRAFGYFLGATFGGPMLDRSTNPALILLVGTAVTAAGAAAVSFLRSVALVCISFILQGVIMGLLDTSGNVLMLAVWRGSKYINGAVHGFHFLFGVGAVTAPVCVSLGLSFGFRSVDTWVACALSFAPACVGFLTLIPMRQPKTSAPEIESTAISSVVLFTGAFLFIYVGLEVAFGGYIDMFAVRHLAYSNVAAANLTSLYWGALSLSRLVATIVTPHVNHSRYIQVHLLLAWIAMAAMGVVCGDASPEGSVGRGLQGRVLSYERHECVRRSLERERRPEAAV